MTHDDIVARLSEGKLSHIQITPSDWQKLKRESPIAQRDVDGVPLTYMGVPVEFGNATILFP